MRIINNNTIDKSLKSVKGVNADVSAKQNNDTYQIHLGNITTVLIRMEKGSQGSFGATTLFWPVTAKK